MAMNVAIAAAPEPHILVVDDDAGLRQHISAYLAEHSLKVDVAQNAAEMEQVLAAKPIEVVVLDVMMPGEDGLSICRRLAARNGPPVIMLSAMGEEVDRIVGLELGADDYLAKPCNPRELLARIRAVLRRLPTGYVAPPAQGAQRRAGAADRGRIRPVAGLSDPSQPCDVAR
jgi:two-component system OmpR family response regulator